MPRLIIINGPPGCGKSTLARMYVDGHALALNLDIDRLRSSIGRWRDDPHSAGLLARAIAVAAARTHLLAGQDVVIPQFIGRVEFLQRLELLAAESGARFAEFVLLDSKENALRAFAERGSSAVAADVQAHGVTDHRGGVEELSAMYDRLISVIDARPSASRVAITRGQQARAYQDLLSQLR